MNPGTSQKKDINRDCFIRFRSNNKEYIRCQICTKYPETIKLYVYNKKIPAIATENGTLYRSDVVEKHILTEYHAACDRVEMIKRLDHSDDNINSIEFSMKKAMANQANHIGKIMIQVFTDAKLMTTAAYNWPARYVTNEAANAFIFNESASSIIPKNISLNYINPTQHHNMLKYIIEADHENIKTQIKQCLAISLRVDGSIDRSQKDKIYVLAKIISNTGEMKLIFLGMCEQLEPGARGLFKATLDAMINMFSRGFVYEIILPKVSSICTDGTNVNTGEKGGLWVYLEKEIAETKSNIPLTKIWCVAHRSNLAFDDLCKNNRKVEKVFRVLSSIASYFHTSSIRTNSLKEIASKHGLNYLVMPKLFEVRWVEYTFQLVKAILTNWHAIALYCDTNHDAQTNGFQTYLHDIENLRLISFCADLLFIFKRFQKQLQSDSLTLPSFCLIVRNFISFMNSLRDQKLLGGFEAQLNDQLEFIDGKYLLKNIELFQKSKNNRTSISIPVIADIRKNVIDTLEAFLVTRLQIPNSDLLTLIERFLKFDGTVNISEIHQSIGRDLELSLLNMQYHDLSKTPEEIRGQSLEKLLRYLVTGGRFEYFQEITTVLARVCACTPHSADCERTISANNILKTSRRMSLLTSTENQYMYIHFNMPELEKWNPRAAVKFFFSETNRRISKTTKTTTDQPFFKHIFENSKESNVSEEHVNDLNIKFRF